MLCNNLFLSTVENAIAFLFGHVKNSGGFKGIRMRDLCDAGVILHQVTLGAGQ